MNSPKGKVNTADIKSLLITAGLFAVASFITYLLQNLGVLQLDPTQAMFVQFVLGMILKFVQKIQSGN